MRLSLLFAFLILASSSCAPAGAITRAESAPERPQVAVVGGGIAGLVTAYELERKGISVQLLEMSDRFGGRITTAHYGSGVIAEYGMMEIWAQNPLAAIARELGLNLEGKVGFSSVILDDKLYPYSQDSTDEYLRSIFSAEEYAALQRWMKQAESLLTELQTSGLTARLAPLNDVSFATWLQEEKLPPRVISFLRLTMECELGTDADSFSAVSALAEFRVFLFGEETAFHVKGGNSKLIDALVDRIRGRKLLGSRVTGVKRSRDADGRITATVTYINKNQVHKVTADRVVLAVPWMNLHMIQLDPPLSPETWDALMTLGRGQYTVVHFVVDKKIHSLWGGAERHPFPVLASGLLGVLYGPEPAPPEQQLEVFSLLIHGMPAREFHLAPQDTKIKEVLGQLERIWPGFSGFVRESAIYPYHPAAIPFWPPGRSPYDEGAKRLFQSFEGLYLAGDYLVSSHSEGAVIAAQRQAATIASELTR